MAQLNSDFLRLVLSAGKYSLTDLEPEDCTCCVLRVSSPGGIFIHKICTLFTNVN